MLGAIKPEVVYFTDSGVGRGVLMIVDLDSAAQAPHVTEPSPGLHPLCRLGDRRLLRGRARWSQPVYPARLPRTGR